MKYVNTFFNLCFGNMIGGLFWDGFSRNEILVMFAADLIIIGIYWLIDNRNSKGVTQRSRYEKQ